MTRITCSDVIGVAQAPFGVLHLVARTRPAAAAALRVQEIHRQSTGGGAGKDPVHSALLGKKPACRTYMTTTWIIAADASRARILQVTDRAQQLEEVEDLVKEVQKLVAGELPKDLSWLNARDIQAQYLDRR